MTLVPPATLTKAGTVIALPSRGNPVYLVQVAGGAVVAARLKSGLSIALATGDAVSVSIANPIFGASGSSAVILGRVGAGP